MSRVSALVAVCCASLGYADTPTDFAGWEDAYQFDCNGPYEHFSTADVKTLGSFRFEHTGATVKLRRATPRTSKRVKLGALAGIKDTDAETFALVKKFIATFEKADVDAIVIGGDTASEPDELERILDVVSSATSRPLLVVAGNMERPAALNYVVLKLRKAGRLNLLNLDTIRRVDGDGFDVVSLAGYHDKSFLHLTGGCIYKDKDIDVVERAAAACDDPVVFLTHGPPRQKGQKALDFVPGADNVGDQRLTEMISRARIAFGLFGHILEAGGHATDLTGKPLPPGKEFASLYLDQGSANPLPWKMNDGTTAYGLAAIVTITGKVASYEVLRGEKPARSEP